MAKTAGVQRDQDVSGDVGLEQRRTQPVRAELGRTDRDQHVDGVQCAENDERESRLAIRQFRDVEQMIDVIGQRAVPFPGVEQTRLEQPLRVFAPAAIGFGFLLTEGRA
jgi:hypothetical protein